MTTGTVNSFQLLNKFHGWRKINNIVFIRTRTLSKKNQHVRQQHKHADFTEDIIENDACFSYFELFDIA